VNSEKKPTKGGQRQNEAAPSVESDAGQKPSSTISPSHPKNRKSLSTDQHTEGVLSGDRAILARTITLIESNAPRHLKIAQEVIGNILPRTGDSIRVGITGVPGAGKSTFIDTLGSFLCQDNHRVAVLAVDPSSSISRGSIMGDKTRMEKLSREENCFIRPSPSGGALGGVNRKTRESMLVCEAAGFDVILVETVGVGQSESMVSTMVDFFLLLTLTGAGDELQNIKRGVIEMADAILINKADGNNRIIAERTQNELNQALHYLTPKLEGWETKAYCCSALKNEGIKEIWNTILDFKKHAQSSGAFLEKRRHQAQNWLVDLVSEEIKTQFFSHSTVAALLPNIQQKVINGQMPVTTGAEELLKAFRKQTNQF